MRVLWMAAELDLDFEHVEIEFDDPALKDAEFRRLNPAGAVPTIVDDGFALSESLAINLYLAKKHGTRGAGALYPDSIQGEADCWRWTLWAQAHLEPWVQQDRLQAVVASAIASHRDAMVRRALAVLDEALAVSGWLVEGRFTVADLNVAGVLSPSRSRHLDLTPHDKVAHWLKHCYARPAAVATRQRFQP
jgi:glutathione S-transferase